MLRTPSFDRQRAAAGSAQESDAPAPGCGSAPHSASRTAHSEKGFTLAGLIVILTIIAVFIAYTVPRQWSKIMQREREKQTIFVMKQYARSIREWSSKHGGATPASLDQLKEARLPRVLRGPKGEYMDPLTGKVDWILVPPTAITTTGVPQTNNGAGVYIAPGTQGTPGTPVTSTTPGTQFSLNKDASPKDYVGPFIGVRPPLTGQSMLKLKDVDQYDQWVYTTLDLKIDIDNATKVNPNQ